MGGVWTRGQWSRVIAAGSLAWADGFVLDHAAVKHLVPLFGSKTKTFIFEDYGNSSGLAGQNSLSWCVQLVKKLMLEQESNLLKQIFLIIRSPTLLSQNCVQKAKLFLQMLLDDLKVLPTFYFCSFPFSQLQKFVTYFNLREARLPNFLFLCTRARSLSSLTLAWACNWCRCNLVRFARFYNFAVEKNLSHSLRHLLPVS